MGLTLPVVKVLGIIAAVLFALPLFTAAAAHADAEPIEPSWQGPPDVGAGCPHADLNVVTTANTGQKVRCMYVPGSNLGYFWGEADGIVQVDPAQGQLPWAHCMQTHTAAECRQIVDGTP